MSPIEPNEPKRIPAHMHNNHKASKYCLGFAVVYTIYTIDGRLCLGLATQPDVQHNLMGHLHYTQM
eukprot:2278962-Pleurochrysis_carterae.AAC.1